MRSVNKNLIVLCSLLSIALTGCMYGPRPYGGGYGANPYGASPYGATYPGYQNGIQTLPPGQQFVPNGTVVPQGVSPGGSPTYGNGGGLNPIPNPGASTSAPPYSGGGNSSTVPDPSTPGGGPFYNNSNSSTFVLPIQKKSVQPVTHNNEPLPAIPNGLRGSNAGSSPTTVYSPDPLPIQSIPNPMNDTIINESKPLPISPPGVGDPFSTPVPAPSSQPIPALPAAGAQPFPGNTSIKANKFINDQTEPFAHHAKYEWIRGVVSKDQPTGTWSVVYSDNPKASDKFAGHISLASSPYLKTLKDGDVIEVKGEVDPVIKDPLGKPVYLVSHVNTITKAPAQDSK